MFTLTFDKGLASERSIQLNSFYEKPIANVFTGNYSVIVESSEDVPSDGGIASDTAIETVEAVNGDGVTIPISGHYNAIIDFGKNYDDASKRYSVMLSLGWLDEN